MLLYSSTVLPQTPQLLEFEMKIIHPAFVIFMYAVSIAGFVIGFIAVTFGSDDMWLKESVAAFGVAMFFGISACFWAILHSHSEVMDKLKQP